MLHVGGNARFLGLMMICLQLGPVGASAPAALAPVGASAPAVLAPVGALAPAALAPVGASAPAVLAPVGASAPAPLGPVGASAAGCLCASDILSCTALGLERVPRELPAAAATLDLSHNRIEKLNAGSFEGLGRLETLRLAQNRLTTIDPGAFGNSSGALLRHLDLSSNQLRALERHYFQELAGLEELLLFNNRIALVEAAALAGLGNLHKAYLSHNRLTDFPFFSIRGHSHPHLSLLDLSSNRLPQLPLEDVSNLPPALQEGLYLHNNSLLCECPMYRLFRLWERRGFDSVRFFRREHVCLVHGLQRGAVRFFLHGRYFEKCDAGGRPEEQEGSVSVRAGAALLLHCLTPLSGRGVSFFWVAPSSEYVAPPGNNGSLKMFGNGSLEIVAAGEEDAGIYLCVAEDRERKESREVNVTVVPRHGGEDHERSNREPFNTGFTTLLGCVVSLVLVLMYLFLTPCRCPPCPRAQPAAAGATSHGNEAISAQSSILTPTPPATTEGPGRKVSTNKHVVFLEPIREQQNGKLRAGLPLGAEQQQRARDTDSFVSVFSDTPIMLP
ncbi:amphoterin-induced protein 3 [Odontesthes bonariensis]|uniref:amphoterin-induced protein 3 n=1 Tax=Odontesthes bonariensis TaxID=219752 RepID=UPI003F58EBDC